MEVIAERVLVSGRKIPQPPFTLNRSSYKMQQHIRSHCFHFQLVLLVFRGSTEEKVNTHVTFQPTSV